ncbi:MAG: N-acetyl-gamma-glutamyl-phosphate reductase [Planctomycetota bacterium]|nr:N-acetyl-gamma-glutamyl-phosphate reductase [Planctomycetota bacterium]
MPTRVGIIGASGYAAADLMRLLLGHPSVEIVALADLPEKCGPLARLFPQFAGRLDIQITPADTEALARACDVVFLALPHTASMTYAGPLLEAGTRVIDFSADYRLRTPGLYEAVYAAPADEANLQEAVYGLPELYRDRIPPARLIANPGCYPTGAILGLAPLVRDGLVAPSDIIIDAKSGISGAGRTPSLLAHFPECNESLKAYKVGAHRHQPEIAEQLAGLARTEVAVLFVPHLAPMDRGIELTMYARPLHDLAPGGLADLYHATYDGEPFVVVRDEPPATKDIAATNYVHVCPMVAGGRVVVSAVVDNLTKGAAGQALQNMNLMFGHDETAGLR